MRQGLLGIQYREEKKGSGTTGLAGLGMYVEMAEGMGLRRMVDEYVGMRAGGQGWRDSDMVLWLMLLNLVGGESVSDVERLEGDEGLRRVMEEAAVYGMGRRERQEVGKRWRVKRERVGPSVSALFRYLGGFHEEEEEGKREEHKAFLPRENKWLRGLWKVNAGMIEFANRHGGEQVATLDMDASVVETQKREAQYSYRKRKAYQPLTTWWHEADMVLHSEFRDGNVPAGYQQLRVMREAMGYLPEGVEEVRLRSDTAGYQQELLKYCAEGRDERFGVIEFAVGVDVTVEFRRAVVRVPEEQWQPVVRGNGEEGRQEWAEVNFVPNWVAQGKKEAVYRFLAIRERMVQAPLPGMGDQWDLPFPAMEMGSRGWYKVFGLVTNRELPGEEVIAWSRQRCGKGEEVHSVLKRDLAGGRLPSGKFGGNAAWWAIAVLAFNLNSIMKWLVWGGTWRHKRLKAIRFGLVALGGRVVRHARRWIFCLARGHPSYPVLLRARERIRELAATPSLA